MGNLIAFFVVIGGLLAIFFAYTLLFGKDGLLFGKRNAEKRKKRLQKITEELVPAYTAATTHEERDAVLDEFENRYGNAANRNVTRIILSRHDVYIPKPRKTDVLEESGKMLHQQADIKDDRSDNKRKHAMNSDFTTSYLEIDDYTVVKGKTSAELELNVKDRMKSGWQPFGAVGAAAFGISPVGGNQYIQAMVKYRNQS